MEFWDVMHVMRSRRASFVTLLISRLRYLLGSWHKFTKGINQKLPTTQLFALNSGCDCTQRSPSQNVHSFLSSIPTINLSTGIRSSPLNGKIVGMPTAKSRWNTRRGYIRKFFSHRLFEVEGILTVRMRNIDDQQLQRSSTWMVNICSTDRIDQFSDRFSCSGDSCKAQRTQISPCTTDPCQCLWTSPIGPLSSSPGASRTQLRCLPQRLSMSMPALPSLPSPAGRGLRRGLRKVSLP